MSIDTSTSFRAPNRPRSWSPRSRTRASATWTMTSGARRAAGGGLRIVDERGGVLECNPLGLKGIYEPLVDLLGCPMLEREFTFALFLFTRFDLGIDVAMFQRGVSGTWLPLAVLAPCKKRGSLS